MVSRGQLWCRFVTSDHGTILLQFLCRPPSAPSVSLRDRHYSMFGGGREASAVGPNRPIVFSFCSKYKCCHQSCLQQTPRRRFAEKGVRSKRRFGPNFDEKWINRHAFCKRIGILIGDRKYILLKLMICYFHSIQFKGWHADFWLEEKKSVLVISRKLNSGVYKHFRHFKHWKIDFQ